MAPNLPSDYVSLVTSTFNSPATRARPMQAIHCFTFVKIGHHLPSRSCVLANGLPHLFEALWVLLPHHLPNHSSSIPAYIRSFGIAQLPSEHVATAM